MSDNFRSLPEYTQEVNALGVVTRRYLENLVFRVEDHEVKMCTRFLREEGFSNIGNILERAILALHAHYEQF